MSFKQNVTRLVCRVGRFEFQTITLETSAMLIENRDGLSGCICKAIDIGHLSCCFNNNNNDNNNKYNRRWITLLKDKT